MRPFAGDRGKARIAGLFILGAMAARVVADAVVRAALVVPGNGRETARNIGDYPLLYRVGEAADMLMLIAMIAAVALLYALFAPAGRPLARVAALSALSGIGMLAAGGVIAMAPPILLNGAPHPGIGMAEVHSLVQLSFDLREAVQGVGRIFLGLYLLLTGILAVRSGRLPRPFGLALVLGGFIQMAVRSVALIAPDLAGATVIQADIVALAAEAGLAPGLLIFWRPRPFPAASAGDL